MKQFIRTCDIYQRHKIEQTKPGGLLQPLPLPQQIWEDVPINFIEGLPVSHGKSSILAVVDRLSKYSHFIPISHPYTAIGAARLFFYYIFKLHGLPKSIQILLLLACFGKNCFV